MTEDKPLLPLAHAAERRLGRLHVWAQIRQRVTTICGAAAIGAAARPFLWPLHHQSPALSAMRALVFAAGAGAIVTTVLVVRAWRSRPSLLTATRRIDGALGLAEVVASGVAFERDKRGDEMARFAISRARRATDGVVVETLFHSEPVQRPRWFRLMIALAAVGLLFGAVDRLLVERAIHPVTAREATAADGLKQSAEKAAVEAKDPAAVPSPQEQAMAEAAKRAAEAAKRGDRNGAMEALEDMRKAERALQAEDRDRARSLRALRDELEAKQGGTHGERPSATASEAVGAMEKDLSKSPSKEEMEKLAERLERAEKAAREAAAKSGSASEKSAWTEAAEALKEAREAAARGDAEGAKKAMAKAQKALSSLEAASKRAGKGGSAAKMSEQASELDRSLRAGAEGKSPGDGKDPSEGNGKGGKGEGSKGKGTGKPGDGKEKGDQPGPGGGGPGERDPVADPKRIKIDGDLQARADVREGEKAVSAIEGMGKGGDPKAYKEIFPAYDTVVEDGLREDNVPAARRPTVRRYFKSIRPGDGEGKQDGK